MIRDIWTVFVFTFQDGYRKRAFRITTVLVLAVILIACCIPMFIQGGEDGQGGGTEVTPAEKSQICYYIDEQSMVPGALPALELALPHIDFVQGKETELDHYRQAVAEDQKYTIVWLQLADGKPSISFFKMDFMSDLPSDTIAQVIQGVYATHLLTAQGLDAQLAQQVLEGIPYSEQILGKMDVSGYAMGILLTLMMFFAVYYYGYSVANSVASEKTTRVMETLVVSTKPSCILLGKCLAMGALGLGQMALFFTVGALGYAFLVPAGFTIMGMPLALSSFTVSSTLLVLLYFILGYALYAMIYSVCGATVSRSEDVSTALMPVILLCMVSFYISYFTLFLSNEATSRIVMYIPFTAPFVMPYRLLNGHIPPGDIAISVALLILSIVAVSAISIRLYSASVLHYGKRLKLGELFRMKS